MTLSYPIEKKVEYDDDVERTRTHPILLPKDEQYSLDQVNKSDTILIHHRSVLGGLFQGAQ